MPLLHNRKPKVSIDDNCTQKMYLYYFSFTTADGKQVQESGYLKDAYIDNAGEPQGTQVSIY